MAGSVEKFEKNEGKRHGKVKEKQEKRENDAENERETPEEKWRDAGKVRINIQSH